MAAIEAGGDRKAHEAPADRCWTLLVAQYRWDGRLRSNWPSGTLKSMTTPRTVSEVKELFEGLRCWNQGGQRAPHKPLLLLFALARLQNGEPRRLAWSDVEGPLTELLRDFGPPRKSLHPEYPFWRLQRDRLWVVDESEELERRRGGRKRDGDVPRSILREVGAHAGLEPSVADTLRDDPALVIEITQFLLEETFPESQWEDVLDAVGMPFVSLVKRRDPAFRGTVLRVYECRCAMCGWDGKLGHRALALEAAHIRWRMAAGPDTANNGLALCALHHRAFDAGALGITPGGTIMVSEHVHGSGEAHHALLQLSGTALRRPVSSEYAPSEPYSAWHREQVFKGPARPAM